MAETTNDRTNDTTGGTAPGPVDVVVVGGGIGGLGSALALTRAGKRVRVLEQAPEFGEVGAGLQMAPNATRILRDWGVLDQVVAAGVVPERLVMRDAMDGTVLTTLDLADNAERYGAPYVVLHRTDLQTILLEACRAAGVDLVTDCVVTDVAVSDDHAVAVSEHRRDRADLVLAADGLSSTLRCKLVSDEPVSSNYVAYRGAVPMDSVRDVEGITLTDVVVYVGPGRHFVQYPLRQGNMFNQVAVFRSPKAMRGEEDWGTPDELDAAFDGSCAQVRSGIPHLWLDRWWRMFDRDPIDRWVDRRFALTGDAAHPMLQYLAQGACQALEDAAELGDQVAKHTETDGSGAGHTDWDAALAAYERDRAPRAASVQTSARAWGDLWHCDGDERLARNDMLRARDPHDYQHVDWLYGA